MAAPEITAIADRIEIVELLARYCDRLDAHDIDGVAATFAPDARADYGAGRGGIVVGRSAIADRIAHGQSAFRRTHHQLGHSTIAVQGDAASAVTAALTWHERFTGERELLALRYVDELVRADGTWWIGSRRVEISLVEGFDGTEWHWWPRHPPRHPA